MHRFSRLQAETLKKRAQHLRLCTGEVIEISLTGNEILFSYGSSEARVPIVSPAIGTEFVDIFHDAPGVLMVWYRSIWKEKRIMPCAAGTVLLIDGVLTTLPQFDSRIAPRAYIQEHGGVLPQLVVSRVESSPFGVPCAALLDLVSLSGNAAGSLIFPTEEPIIIEGMACTAMGGRIHHSKNLPGTGLCEGDVPFIYPWVNLEGTRHGWAATRHREWEVQGKERPTAEETVQDVDQTVLLPSHGERETFVRVEHIPNVVADRQVHFDALDDRDEELYEVFLGENECTFRFFSGCEGRTGFALQRGLMKEAVLRHFASSKASIRCGCRS